MGNTLTIFDLDNTLIQGDSSTVWSQFMVREGLATQKGYLAREARLMADYDRGRDEYRRLCGPDPGAAGRNTEIGR
ncbi:hypothetical protein LNO81_05070 [Klebsiella variicola subsp. variicola]|nr:hypothetical protein [Klebsiella variicola subsp. variicola]